MTIHQVRDKQISGTPMATCRTLINNTRSRRHLCWIVMGLVISVTSYNDWWVGDLWSILTEVRALDTVPLCVSVSVVIEKKIQNTIHQDTNFLNAFFFSFKLNLMKPLKVQKKRLKVKCVHK